MNKNKGFTLIELVVVIVILGIIGVVASLKTMELPSDARVAVMKSSRAAIQSAFDLFHAKQEMVNANITTEDHEGNVQHFLTINGVKILINKNDGYPLFRVLPRERFLKEFKALVNMDVELFSNDDKYKTNSKFILFPNNYSGFHIFFRGQQPTKGNMNVRKCYVEYIAAKQFVGAPDISEVKVATSEC
ncbi:prepilin-type N-terminal cleavage/methylation domain-containing protein [Photobacterium leiognathi]|uniref:prepilin-type N-terminal cleavage/methylation domain-containing protein n=1 Tax=Photobacterium leiognathi TaxID=553611 RepID=UPI002981A226|nr:prepilin-type N-terminal cleavage/methylation domain-containing protein [Photobacterium leiognathi]